MSTATPNDTTRCSTHPEDVAHHRCTRCDRDLCWHCIDTTTDRRICVHCGARASAQTAAARRSTLEPPQEDGIALAITNHVVVPSAIIAMVASLLFYLLDVRSVFLAGTFALKWIGACFVFATVLIARYGRMSGDADRQGCYSGALAVATVLSMSMGPWERGGVLGWLASAAIVVGVWFFASRLTRQLSLEDLPRDRRRERPLYGVERLRLARLAAQQTDRPQAHGGAILPGRVRAGLELGRLRREKGDAEQRADAHGNPNAGVARLALVALATFGLGEPILLQGPPEAGMRALVAVMTFVLATAVVLAAGASVGTLRQARRLGAHVRPGMIPLRLSISLVLAMAVLVATLGIPGLHFRGSGERGPMATQGADVAHGEAKRGEPGGDQSGDAQGDGEASDASGGEAGQGEGLREPPPPDALSEGIAAVVVEMASTLGQLLRIPLIIAAILFAIFLAWQLWPHVLRWRPGGPRWFSGLLKRLIDALDRLRRLRGRRRPATTSARTIDPFAARESLGQLPPEEAVRDAYRRLLAFLDQHDHDLGPDATPHEILGGLPPRLRTIRAAAEELTELYVRTDYSASDIGPSDRDQALRALDDVADKAHALA